jgi:hypothetical protein
VLPAAPSTNRPISITALAATVTMASAGGTIHGGSVNASTPVVTNDP